MLVLMAIAGCETEELATPTLAAPSPVDPPTWVDTGLYRPDIPDDVALDNDVPEHLLTIQHVGFWERSGDPADVVLGELHVRELFDGYVPPVDTDIGLDTDTDEPETLECDARWTVTGTPADQVPTCSGCGTAWRLQFSLSPDSVSDPSGCRDQDIPSDGRPWIMAYNPTTGMVMREFGGTGVWYDFWVGVETGSRIDLTFETTVAVDIEEEDE